MLFVCILTYFSLSFPVTHNRRRQGGGKTGGIVHLVKFRFSQIKKLVPGVIMSRKIKK